MIDVYKTMKIRNDGMRENFEGNTARAREGDWEREGMGRRTRKKGWSEKGGKGKWVRGVRGSKGKGGSVAGCFGLSDG